MPRVAVIGAGAAGLSAAKHLIGVGCDVTVFELGFRIGGLWVYENDNGLSPAYASLHLNSENRVTAYRDFPFPENAPLYPDHAAVARYLEAYADHFGLRCLIRFNAWVVAVEPGWTVRLANGTVEGSTQWWWPLAIKACRNTRPLPGISPASTLMPTPTARPSASAARTCWWWASAIPLATSPPMFVR